MSRYKILHISKFYAPYSGGIEDVCRSLVEGVPEFDQKVLCFNDGSADKTDYYNGTEVVRVGIFREMARQPLSTHFVSVMKKMLRDYQPDVIHFHAPNPLVSLYILLFVPKEVKVVVHWHSDIIVHKYIHFFYSPIEKRLLRRADAIIATSPNYVEGSALLRIHREKCHIIPNIIYPKKLEQVSASGLTTDDIHAKYGDQIVLFVGRHVSYKGIDCLIEASRYFKEGTQVLIAGRGPWTDELKVMAQGRENIHFIGRIADDEIGTYMQAAKVFAFPSVTKNEAFGVVLAEAMYCGLVPVTFTIEGSGVNWVSVNGQTGIEVPNSDIAAYAEAVSHLLDDSRLRLSLSKNARKRVKEKFLFEHIHDKLIHLYESLIRKSS